MMKTRMILFVVITLFLLIGVGCEEKNEAKTILPISGLYEQVVTFFETELPNATKANCFFSSQENNAYYLINSMAELQAIYSCDNELPEIDFTQYSVIIGQHGMANSFYSVVEQRIEETETLELSIHVKLPDEHWPASSLMYYWGVYPKLPNKKVSINVVS